MADMDTTYSDGGIQTRTQFNPQYAPSTNLDEMRKFILSLRRPAQENTQASMGPVNTSGHYQPAQSSGPAGQTGVIYRKPERRFNTAPLQNMDIMAGDMQKTAMQRMTDRSNQMRAMMGVPSGDTQQGSYNAGHASFLPAEANAQMAMRQPEMTAGEKTAAARRMLIGMAPPQRG
jgi:hypothetical protein